MRYGRMQTISHKYKNMGEVVLFEELRRQKPRPQEPASETLGGLEEQEAEIIDDPFIQRLISQLRDASQASVEYQQDLLEAERFIKDTEKLLDQSVTTEIDLAKAEEVLEHEEAKANILREHLRLANEQVDEASRHLRTRYEDLRERVMRMRKAAS